MTTAMSSLVVVIERLDDGYPEEPGQYRCTECQWKHHNAARRTVTSHANRTHGKSLHLSRLVEMKERKRVLLPLSEEGVDRAVIRKREVMRDCRARKKVSGMRIIE